MAHLLARAVSRSRLKWNPKTPSAAVLRGIYSCAPFQAKPRAGQSCLRVRVRNHHASHDGETRTRELQRHEHCGDENAYRDRGTDERRAPVRRILVAWHNRVGEPMI